MGLDLVYLRVYEGFRFAAYILSPVRGWAGSGLAKYSDNLRKDKYAVDTYQQINTFLPQSPFWNLGRALQ
jgi:hypothetical protein